LPVPAPRTVTGHAADLDHLGLIPGGHDEIGGDVIEAGLQDGGVPKEIARFGFYRDGVFVDVEMREGGFCRRNIGGQVHGIPIRWSSSA
jgi:hypothetical protein